MSATPRYSWAGWVGVLSLVVVTTVVSPAFAAGEVLFPAPLHLTRELTDPISGSKSVVDEYCHGNRVVAVSGRRTSIAEYDKGVLTTIDFEAGTYSVTKFEELARAWARGGPSRREEPQAAMTADGDRAGAWRVESRGGKVVASRPGEAMEARREDAHGKQTIRVTGDRQLKLSRAAVEVLTGTAWPRRPDPSADVLLNALKADAPQTAGTAGLKSAAQYALPLEHAIEQTIDGDTVTIRSVVLRVGSELPPPDLLAVPPGAKLVESEAVAARRLLDELDGVRPAQH